MGAFTGACLLAMAGAFLVTFLFDGAALAGGWLGAFVGAIAGFAGSLWLILRDGGEWGGKAVTALTGIAIMLVVCLAYVAFS